MSRRGLLIRLTLTLATALVLLGCAGAADFLQGPSLARTELRSGERFQLSYTSTGAATEVWITHSTRFERVPGPQLDLAITARRGKRVLVAVDDRVPLRGDWGEEATGSNVETRTILDIPAVPEGERVVIRGVLDARPGTHLEHATLGVRASSRH